MPRVHRTRAPPRPRADQELRRSPRARRRRPRPAPRPGARPGRRERRRQVDADEDPRRRAPGRRGHRRARRRAGLVQPPGPGPAGRPLHGLPGVQPAARAHGRREHLPRPRAAPPRPGRHRPDAAATPSELLDDLGVTGLRPGQRVALALRRRAADRRDRQGDQLRRPDHPDGRADRRPGRPRGRAALRDHRAAHRPRRRDPLRLPPAQGDLRPLRHHHRAQGRPAGRHPGRPPSSTTPSWSG